MILLVYFDVLDFPGFQVGQNDFRILKRFISFMNGEFTPYKHLILPIFGLLSLIIRYVVNFSYSLPEIYQLRTILEYQGSFSFTDIATSIILVSSQVLSSAKPPTVAQNVYDGPDFFEDFMHLSSQNVGLQCAPERYPFRLSLAERSFLTV